MDFGRQNGEINWAGHEEELQMGEEEDLQLLLLFVLVIQCWESDLLFGQKASRLFLSTSGLQKKYDCGANDWKFEELSSPLL